MKKQIERTIKNKTICSDIVGAKHYLMIYDTDVEGIAQNIVDMVLEQVEGLEVNYFLDAQAFIRKDKLINLLKQD